MSRVLVTGASGFIGSKLAQRLVEQGHDVTCLVRESSRVDGLKELGVRLAYGDVRDAGAVRAAVQGQEAVYHLAGLVSAFRASDLMDVNAAAFRHLLSSCALCTTPPTVVQVSSMAAAGPAPPGRPRIEADPPAPVSNYGRAKRAAERSAEEFADRLSITVVRPPIVFGPGDFNMRNVFKSIYRYRWHLAVGVSKSRYSLVHVEDLVGALTACGERGARLAPRAEASNAARGFYFVAGEEQPTFVELGRLIAKSLDRRILWMWRSSGPTLIWPAAAIAEVLARFQGQPYIFNFDKAREARAGNWTCSAAAIRRDLDFAPRLPLTERLSETAKWYLENDWL